MTEIGQAIFDSNDMKQIGQCVKEINKSGIQFAAFEYMDDKMIQDFNKYDPSTTQWQKSEMCDTLFPKFAQWNSLTQKSHCIGRFQGKILAFLSPVRVLTIKSKNTVLRIHA